MIFAVVIDDSAFNRVTITRMLESAGDVRVVATAVDGEDGIKQVLRHRPDVVTLDLEMPGMDGFSFLRWLMASRPTPVIVVSSRASDRNVFKALELGAVDFIGKPGGRVSPRLEEISSDLISKVRQCANVRLDNVRKRIRDEEPAPVPAAPLPPAAPGAIDCVVIGASTGGPPALQMLVQSLPMLPSPIVIAQHMPPVFTRLFAERVNRLGGFAVKEAEDGEPLRRGGIYIAPGGMQTTLRRDSGGLRARVQPRREADLYAPSVNKLFSSAAEVCGEKLVAVVLTGMGDDGAAGIRQVASRGGITLAEAASTAIIYGMPAEAIRTGAVREVLPLPEIADAIARHCLGEAREGSSERAPGERNDE
ncbi:MAG TPA: chemotaxis-specific protein-glutamate methyltransferase CheB [Thermoanaerobaculia bacterium]|nr:chemotaxis-specific protein-glutamate methyltransferase CheB [Thermoanaerobaculia bacterium]